MEAGVNSRNAGAPEDYAHSLFLRGNYLMQDDGKVRLYREHLSFISLADDDHC